MSQAPEELKLRRATASNGYVNQLFVYPSDYLILTKGSLSRLNKALNMQPQTLSQHKYTPTHSVLWRLTILFTALWIAPSSLYAQTPQESRFWVTDGTINSITNNEASTYIGGDFSYVGPNTGLAAELGISNNLVFTALPYIDKYIDGISSAEVFTIISDEAGGWFIGGNFTKVANESHPYLIHVLANKSLDINFNFKPNAPVRSLHLSADNKTLFVAGEFTSIAATPRNRLAAITLADSENSTPHELASWNPSIDDGLVNALEINHDDSVLYVGGSFSSVNGDSNIQGITAIDTLTGISLTDWLTGANSMSGIINSIVITRENIALATPLLFVGGSFTAIRGVNRNNLAALSTLDGSVINTWASSTDGEVHVVFININNTKLYIGGAFNNVDASAQKYLARIDTDSITASVDAAWSPVVNAQVKTLHFDDYRPAPPTGGTAQPPSNLLYLGGDFTKIAASSASDEITFDRDYAARLSIIPDTVTPPDITQVNNWLAHATAPVNTLGLRANASQIAAGGQFSSIRGIKQSNFVELDTATGTLTSTWRPKVNGSVNLMHFNSDFSYLYIAGDFTHIDNKPRRKIARFNTADGSVDAWAPNIENGEINALTLSNTTFKIQQIEVEPNATGRVYAATDKGLYTSHDSGLSWILNTNLPGTVVHKIVIDPNTTSTLYAATDDNGILRSTDRGLTWTQINTGLANTTVKDIAISQDSKRLYISTDSWITDEQLTAFPLYFSEDQGTTWTLIANAESRINTIRPSPLDSGIIYLGNAQGLYIMEREIPEGKSEYAHTLRDCNPNTAVPDPCNVGLDIGANITTIIATEPEVIGTDNIPLLYVIADGALFKSEDNAELWRRLANQDLPRAATLTSIIANPNTPSTLYLSLLGHGIYKSTDSGLSWHQSNNGLNNFNLNTVATDPSNPNILYTGANRSTIEKSTNGGDFWSESHAGIPNDTVYIGGSFFGSHPEYLAALDSSNQPGSLFLNWNTYATNQVNSLALTTDSSTLYVAGSFNSIGGEPRNLVAAIDTASAKATGWSPDVTGNSVQALALDEKNNKLYLGGDFTRVNAIDRSNLAAVKTVDDNLLPWNPNVKNGSVSSLKLMNSNNLIIAGGDFNEIGDRTGYFERNNLASLTASSNPNFNSATSTNNTSGWNPSPNSAISGQQAFSVSKDTLLVGGGFERINEKSIYSLASFNLKAPSVKATPTGGAYTQGPNVALTCSQTDERVCEDTNILYTTDSDLSNATWTAYSGPVSITTSVTLSFFSVDNEGAHSSTVSQKYIIDNNRPSADIELASGKYTTTHTSKLTCNDGDESLADVSKCRRIFYTLDGSKPVFIANTSDSTNQTQFTATGTTIEYKDDTPVPIRINSVLRVIAVDSAGNISREIVGHYEIERGKGSGGSTSFGALLALLLILIIRQLTTNKVHFSAKYQANNYTKGD